MPKIQITTSRIQNNCLKIGRNFADRTRDVSSHGSNAHTKIAPNIKMTPNSLSGTDRKIAIAADARRLMENYSYPGNVRQLESAIERAILLCENDTITIEDLPPEMTQGSTPAAAGDLFSLPPEGVNFEDVERSLIMQAMGRTDNNITKSAKLLGLTFRTLQYRLEKFGFKKDGTEEEEEA